jgi:hypothetical protein
VIRETIRDMNKVAIGRVVLTSREYIIALEPLDKGLMGTLLRYLYEVRAEGEYFDEIQDVKVTKTCSTWPNTSSIRRPDGSSRRSSRTSTKQRWSTSSTRSAPASQSQRRTVPLEAMSWTLWRRCAGALAVPSRQRPRLAHAIDLVGAQIVHEDDIALFQGRRENLLDICNECWPIHRAIDDIGRGHAIEPQGSDERQRLPVAVWHARDQPLAARAAAAVTDHFRRDRGLVN